MPGRDGTIVAACGYSMATELFSTSLHQGSSTNRHSHYLMGEMDFVFVMDDLKLNDLLCAFLFVFLSYFVLSFPP